MRAAYRVRQFGESLFTRPDARDLNEALATLSEAERALFLRLSRADQSHSLKVWRVLRARGFEDAPLLRAALLHDVGKVDSGITVFHRVAVVLLGRFAPALLAWLATRGERVRWLRPIYVSTRHAAIGARKLTELGASPLVVELVARHHESPLPTDDEWLNELRRADGLA